MVHQIINNINKSGYYKVSNISVFLLAVFMGGFLGCTDNAVKPEESGENSESKLAIDRDLLNLGMNYYNHQDSKYLAYRYISKLIEEGGFTTALFLLEDLSPQTISKYKYDSLYFMAAKGSHRFDKILDFPPEEFPQYENQKEIIESFRVILAYTDSIQNNSTKARYYNKRGEAYFETGYKSAANFDFQRALELAPVSFSVLYNNLYAKYASGKYSEALDLIKINSQKINEFPVNKQNVINKMQKAFDQLLKIEQNKELSEPQKHFQKAKIFSRAKDFDIAIREINKAINKEKSFADAWAFRAYIYYQKDELQNALRDIKKAEELSGKKNTNLGKMIRSKLNK
jgi:tetratricopeptide (TPR) repeat protein